MADWPSPVVGRLRVYGSAHYSPANGSGTFIDFDTEDPAWTKSGVTHTNSGTTALTGTVQKTSGSAAVVGTGTAFTTELKVSDQIIIPGTANETRVVKTITDATHLTVDTNLANSASGQTATRKDNTRLQVLSAGLWLLNAGVWWNPVAGGVRFTGVAINGAVGPNQVEVAPAGAADGTGVPFTFPLQLAAQDFVQIIAYQTSGAALGLTAGTRFTWASLVRLGD